MALYSTLAIFMIARDFQSSGTGFGNLESLLRIAPFYMTFFIILGFVADRRDYERLTRIWFGLCITGTVLIILQSLHGTDPLFAGTGLDQVFTPPSPMITEHYGPLHRTVFPFYFAAVWAIFYCLARWTFSPSVKWLLSAQFFSVAFIFNLARGLYFGVLCAFVAFVLLMVRTRRMVGQIMLAVTIPALIIGVTLPAVGYSDLATGIAMRVGSGLQDVQSGGGTWGGRLDQVAQFRRLAPGPVDLWFGYGYLGVRSGLSLSFIELGFVDLVYRGGLLGAAVMGFIVFRLIVFASKTTLTGRRRGDQVLAALGIATTCSLISEVGHLPSANHFYYQYYPAMIGVVVAIIACHLALTETIES
jgi:hypothetical protein